MVNIAGDSKFPIQSHDRKHAGPSDTHEDAITEMMWNLQHIIY